MYKVFNVNNIYLLLISFLKKHLYLISNTRIFRRILHNLAVGTKIIIESFRLEKTFKIIKSNANLTLARPPLNHVLKCRIFTFF